MTSDAHFLAVDAGNTRVKWALHGAHGWDASGSVATADIDSLEAAWAPLPTVPRAFACNVAGEDVQRAIERACAAKGAPPVLLTSRAQQLGVVNGYRDPAQLGADRWVALIAANANGHGHKLVVNAGTALTIDALEDGGRFAGGLIVPGTALMRASLARGTAGLRLTQGQYADFPASTPDAIASGALQAGVGAVERMRRAMENAGTPPLIVLLSGGAAGELAPHLSMPFAIHENLVLDGIALIARAS
jgi:type III pantothenate kinase